MLRTIGEDNMSGSLKARSREELLSELDHKLRATCEGDSKWNQFYDEYNDQIEERNRLLEEIDKLKETNVESRQVNILQLDLRKEVALSKSMMAFFQRGQRQLDLWKSQLEDDLKAATSHQERERIRQRLKEVDGSIQPWKSQVHDWEERVNQEGEELKQLESIIIEEESHRLCEEALSQGYIVIKVAITVVVGPAGVGKTLLKFLLLEKKPPTLRSSTPGADAPILIQVRTVSAERFRKLGKKWQEVSTDQMLPLIARYIRSTAVEKEEFIPEELKEYLEQLQTTTANNTSQDVASATPSDGVSTSSLESTPPSAVNEASACLPTESEPFENEAATLKNMIDTIMGKLEKLVVEEGLSEDDAENLFSREWIYFTDSGGQPQFHELLPLFVRDISSVVIVSRLCDRLDQYPTDEYYKDGKLIGKCESAQLTCEDQMKCLIRSLLSRNSPDKLPKVIMVGTHLDMAGECSESMEQKDKKLIEMLGPEFSKQLVYYKPFKKLLFPLNALNPGEQDKAVVASVRSAIETSIAKEVKVPIKWYILEHLIQELAKSLKKRVFSKKLCASIASALGFTEKSFEAALQFFDQLNVIKYSNALPEVIFVDSQLPLDKISELVQHSYMLKHAEVSTPLEGDWKRFCDEGVLNLKFLQSFPNHYVRGLFEAPQFLELLKEQLVAVPLAKLDLSPEAIPAEYFMPALLDILSQEELEKHRVFSSAAAPLLFRFSHGCRRAGVFCCLVVYLMKESKWSIQHRNKKIILVARNCVSFRVTNDDHRSCIVTLIDAFYFFEVHIAADTPLSLCREVCPTIRRDILAGIGAACDKLHYINDQPQLAVFCPSCDCSTKKKTSSYDGDSHHAAVLERNSCECIETSRHALLTDQHTIWLTEECQATGKQVSGTVSFALQARPSSEVGTLSASAVPSIQLNLPTQQPPPLLRPDTFTTASLPLTERHQSLSQYPSSSASHLPHILDYVYLSSGAMEDISDNSKPNSTNLTVIRWRNDKGEVKKFRLKSSIIHKWRDIGNLVLPRQQLEVWARRKDDKECCEAVLSHWLDHSPCRYPATWEGLYELLDDSELGQVAAELKQAVDNAI